MGPPKGPALARSGSTWIHWWSPVASANCCTRSWVTSSQSLSPTCCPTSAVRPSTPSTTLGSATGPNLEQRAQGLDRRGGIGLDVDAPQARRLGPPQVRLDVVEQHGPLGGHPQPLAGEAVDRGVGLAQPHLARVDDRVE